MSFPLYRDYARLLLSTINSNALDPEIKKRIDHIFEKSFITQNRQYKVEYLRTFFGLISTYDIPEKAKINQAIWYLLCHYQGLAFIQDELKKISRKTNKAHLKFCIDYLLAFYKKGHLVKYILAPVFSVISAIPATATDPNEQHFNECITALKNFQEERDTIDHIQASTTLYNALMKYDSKLIVEGFLNNKELLEKIYWLYIDDTSPEGMLIKESVYYFLNLNKAFLLHTPNEDEILNKLKHIQKQFPSLSKTVAILEKGKGKQLILQMTYQKVLTLLKPNLRYTRKALINNPHQNQEILSNYLETLELYAMIKMYLKMSSTMDDDTKLKAEPSENASKMELKRAKHDLMPLLKVSTSKSKGLTPYFQSLRSNTNDAFDNTPMEESDEEVPKTGISILNSL